MLALYMYDTFTRKLVIGSQYAIIKLYYTILPFIHIYVLYFLLLIFNFVILYASFMMEIIVNKYTYIAACPENYLTRPMLSQYQCTKS